MCYILAIYYLIEKENMKNTINKSYQELLNFGNIYKPYPIYIIKSWLEKYNDLYQKCEKSYYLLCNNCKISKEQGMPYYCICNPEYCNKKEYKNDFLKLYDTLNDIVQIHKHYDKYALAYDNIATDLLNGEVCSDLTIKYVELWNSLHFFYSEYINDDEDNLSITKIPNTNFEITLIKEEFELIYTFYECYGKVCNE